MHGTIFAIPRKPPTSIELGSTLSYKEQLQHPLWQKKAAEVKRRADWKCEDCGRRDRQLHAHHTAYVPGMALWNYDWCLLMCLCDLCHESRQRKEDAFRVGLGQITRILAPEQLDQEVWRILQDVSVRETSRLAEAFS